MARISWPESLLDVLTELEEKERELILKKVEQLKRFPEMYPLRSEGRFRQHRWFVAGDWLVYYRVVGQDVYIRALWPARIP